MSAAEKTILTAETEISAPIAKAWELWNNPQDIKQWNTPGPEWHTTHAENDLRPGGRFLYVMEMKDGSFSFNFQGIYDEVKPYELIRYTLDDGRKSTIAFTDSSPVKLIENFEPDGNEPLVMQREFCKAVLDKFARYVEGVI
jgi:uncharacterized protein YndB with AHSA1/START domain